MAAEGRDGGWGFMKTGYGGLSRLLRINKTHQKIEIDMNSAISTNVLVRYVQTILPASFCCDRIQRPRRAP